MRAGAIDESALLKSLTHNISISDNTNSSGITLP